MRSKSDLWSTLAYAAMILAAIAIFCVVRDYGDALVAPAPQTAAADAPQQPAGAQANALSHVLLALAAVAKLVRRGGNDGSAGQGTVALVLVLVLVLVLLSALATEQIGGGILTSPASRAPERQRRR
jgi:hypothetical protein